METTQEVRTMNAKEMTLAIHELQAAVKALNEKLEALSTSKSAGPEREMTDKDAHEVTYGSLKDIKHKDAAQKLGLSYGQVYSCRLGFTFKGVHKAAREQGLKNDWIKG